MYRSYKDICSIQNNVKTDRTIFLPKQELVEDEIPEDDVQLGLTAAPPAPIDPSLMAAAPMAAAPVASAPVAAAPVAAAPAPVAPMVKENYPVSGCNYTSLFSGLNDKNYQDSNKRDKIPAAVEESFNENSSEMVATNPQVWGPKAWDFLHTISFAYPNNPSEQKKQSAMNFFMALPDMLPCDLCSQHCRENLEKNPPNVDNKDTLSRWLVKFHNEVNRQTNRQNKTKKKMFTYEEAQKMYDGGMCFHTEYSPYN